MNSEAWLPAGFSTACAPPYGGTLVRRSDRRSLRALAIDKLGKRFLPGIPGGSRTGGIAHAFVQCVTQASQGVIASSNAPDVELLP